MAAFKITLPANCEPTELWIRFATTAVCHKCVYKQTKSFVIGQNDGWNMEHLFLSFPYLFLNDSCPRTIGEEGGWRGLSFDAQQFFQNKRVQSFFLIFSHLFIQSLSFINADWNTHKQRLVYFGKQEQGGLPAQNHITRICCIEECKIIFDERIQLNEN